MKRKKVKESLIKLKALFRKYTRRIIFLLNIFVGLALFASYFAIFIDSESLYFISFLGLIYPFLLIVNLCFTIFWLFFKPKRSFISIFIILLGWQYLFKLLHFGNNNTKSDNHQLNIKVLSYNVRLFNRWEWLKDRNIDVKTIDYIANANANIVCIQEFYSNELKGYNTVDSIKNKSNLQNEHIVYAKKLGRKLYSGIATFTSYPIVNKGVLAHKSNKIYCIYTDVIIADTTVRIYNIHLESIHLGYSDYNVIKNISNTENINVEGIHSIYTKMKNSVRKRNKQACVIAKSIAQCKYPVILCGDFNDTPFSYVYHRLLEGMVDSFTESGSSFENTYKSTMPIIRIDFIIHSKCFKSFKHQTEKVNFSDHNPVKSSLTMNNL